MIYRERLLGWIKREELEVPALPLVCCLLLYERRDQEPEEKNIFFFNIANHSVPHPLLVKKYLSCMHSWREFSKNTPPTRILFIPQNLPRSCERSLRLRRVPPLSAHQHFLAPLIPVGSDQTSAPSGNNGPSHGSSQTGAPITSPYRRNRKKRGPYLAKLPQALQLHSLWCLSYLLYSFCPMFFV